MSPHTDGINLSNIFPHIILKICTDICIHTQAKGHAHKDTQRHQLPYTRHSLTHACLQTARLAGVEGCWHYGMWHCQDQF